MWPKIGCGSNFVPFAKGLSTVVEMKLPDDTWTAFAAQRFPPELDDAIKGKHAEFYMAAGRLTPQELLGEIPVCFPMTYQIDTQTMPGAARYPIDEWEKAGCPSFSTVSWIKLCVKVAEGDMTNLANVFEVGAKLLAKM